jgi:hypothetical protein
MHLQGGAMKYRCLITILALILMFIPGQTAAEMSSTNYRIPTTVVSGGGVPMGSAGFQTNGTLGQPSPLADPADPPFSDSYDLYPGFWHTLVAYVPLNDCPGDFENDGDVDGSDLAVFAADFGRTDCSADCEGDFDNDGDVDGSDLAVFAADFGRTDCIE